MSEWLLPWHSGGCTFCNIFFRNHRTSHSEKSTRNAVAKLQEQHQYQGCCEKQNSLLFTHTQACIWDYFRFLSLWARIPDWGLKLDAWWKRLRNLAASNFSPTFPPSVQIRAPGRTVGNKASAAGRSSSSRPACLRSIDFNNALECRAQQRAFERRSTVVIILLAWKSPLVSTRV